MKLIVCISLIGLLCISGCTAPTTETWKGFRVTEDCTTDVPKPKFPGRPRRAVMERWSELNYRTVHY